MATVFERLKKIFVQEFEVEENEVVPEALLVEDLALRPENWDLIELVMLVEGEFGVEISDEEAEKMLNRVQDLVGWLHEHGVEDDP